VIRALAAVGERLPLPPADDGDLDRALAFLGAGVGAETAHDATRALALAGGAVTAACAALAPALAFPVAAVWTVLAAAPVTAPEWAASVKRSRAAGGIPEVVTLATLRARVEPSPERAATFAASHARGALGASLREHVERARGRPGAGLAAFAETWSDHDPAARRSVSLLLAATAAGEGDRARLLDRSLDTALDAARERATRYAASVRGPAGALYAFGVVLPLALVAGLPAAGAAGIPVTVAAVVAVYDGLLPVCLVAGSVYVLSGRPAAFPPTAVPPDHPALPGGRRRVVRPVAAGVVAGGVGAIGARFVPSWAGPSLVVGCAVGAALIARFRPAVRVRDRAEAVESGLADAVSLVGLELERGVAPEAAVEAAADLDGATGEVFAEAARLQRTLGRGARSALLGDGGALDGVPSPRASAAATVMALAAREGTPGGRVLVELADHLDELRAAERDARDALSGIAGTLRSTACCFAPLIGGVTVSLAGRVTAEGARIGTPLPVDGLGLAVGGYVLLTAALLAALATALERGLDRQRAGYHAGVALLAAAATYATSAAAAGVLV
jgi:hypothetical protein